MENKYQEKFGHLGYVLQTLNYNYSSREFAEGFIKVIFSFDFLRALSASVVSYSEV